MSPDSADASSALRALARDLGVSTRYWGWDGQQKDVADGTLHAVLAALGAPVDSDADIAAVRHERERAPWRRTLPPVTVMREDLATSVPVHVEHGTAVRLHLRLEDGGRRDLDQGEDHTPPFDLDGRLRGRARFHLPAGLPLGWHRLVAETSEGAVEADLVVTPARLTVHEEFAARRAVGLQAQLYSVRSERSWGVGDLADLRDLAAIAGARHGADFLLINPLHASYPTPPVEPSPYLPVTRRFTSALYLRVEDVPEFGALPEHARQRIALLRESVAGWNGRADRLERDEVLAAKLAALEELAAVPLTAGRRALLDAYRAREGQGLEDFALWCAIAEQVRGTEDEPLLQHLDEEVLDRARRELTARIDVHVWVQWLLDEQLRAAQSAAREAGMRIGVMHDLAVGVEQVGADSWRLQEVLASGAAVGAPADQYNQQGQNWHQPPWHPERLREASYRPWRDMLRTLMRHAGALRIDHVLGLFRLWWVPEGHEAADGAYVAYDHEAMIGILALEAQRSGTLVVGEDLGTFEPWVRDHLVERGILGTSILWFEADGAGRPLPAEDYRTLCMSSVNTHDLPPTTGYLAGDHVALRHRLGLLERPLEEELSADAAGREQVLDLLRAEGLLAEGAGLEETVIALHRHLARTPSLLLGVSLVDCVGERRIQNQPGTDEEYPNWRIPLADPAEVPVALDDIATDPRTARLMAAVHEELRRR
ncbi:4-alpha-glucanotransferase [Brachybacterium saurashtrense]|uniref:4-alpha-glucanotransferase n=1 Tax=Brachybacterium saurashtrense TaxID=556288 RepID=A0A345YLR7_9MICO|nr:4-alpha-glucanotransferase [Brachybacterium saurashtrense]AXK44869.1 4-alpha-glucanotransferase [Brachybacterium saurashtrense]RRR20850.1 4-alpha-glucanotransferase [Brachybacterium saurashtrense]